MRVRLSKVIAKTRRRLLVAMILVLLIGLVPFTSPIPVAEAAPTGQMTLISDPENFLNFTEIGVPGQEETVRIHFTNTAGAAITDVASTIQYVTLAAANLNPSRVEILAQASWLIHDPSNQRPDLGPFSVQGTNETAPAIYSPYSNTTSVAIWHWNLGPPDGVSSLMNYTDSSQFAPDLRILRPGEWVDLNITIRCTGMVGDSRIWFFPRATEFEPASVPVTALSTIPDADRMNIYYQKTALPIRPVGWYPLHVSYDPYDANIDSGTGHSFEQIGSAPLYGWTRIPTTTRFAKTSKEIHQTQSSDGTGEPVPSTIHICGTKFLDLNGNGVYDPETEPGIDGVTVTLLGADAQTLASQYYPGNFTYPPPEDQPPLDTLPSGENMLLGSYCFNLINVKPGTYTFYVKVLEPDGLTTPALIGPIVIAVSDTSPATLVFSIDHNFGNLPEVPPPVGGVPFSVDKLGLLAPWIGLLGVLGFLVSVVAVRKKHED